jgi:deoxyribose-phosphate aldolase
MDLASRIQHTLIRTDATHDDVVRHCGECVEYGFDAAMVAGDWLPVARRFRIKAASALDFPVAAMTTAGRVAEARALCEAGASEIDVGCKIGWLRSGRADEFRADLFAVVRAAAPAKVKVMLELPLLEPLLQEQAVRLAVDAGAAYVKNASSGAVGRATPEQIRFLRAHAPAEVGVKASGGIDSYEIAVALVEAGADLLGSSSGVEIVSGCRPRSTRTSSASSASAARA